MNTSTILLIIAIIVVVGVIILRYFVNNSNPFKMMTNKPKIVDKCLYDGLISTFGTVNSIAGQVSFKGISLNSNLLIYVEPNSTLYISEKEMVVDKNTNLFIDGYDDTARNISMNIDKLINNCNLINNVNTIIIGNNGQKWPYTIKTLNYPAIVFMQKGLQLGN